MGVNETNAFGVKVTSDEKLRGREGYLTVASYKERNVGG